MAWPCPHACAWDVPSELHLLCQGTALIPLPPFKCSCVPKAGSPGPAGLGDLPGLFNQVDLHLSPRCSESQSHGKSPGICSYPLANDAFPGHLGNTAQMLTACICGGLPPTRTQFLLCRSVPRGTSPPSIWASLVPGVSPGPL